MPTSTVPALRHDFFVFVNNRRIADVKSLMRSFNCEENETSCPQTRLKSHGRTILGGSMTQDDFEGFKKQMDNLFPADGVVLRPSE